MVAKHKTLSPVFFAHGSPVLAVEDTAASRFLKGFAASRPTPDAIVILSAHWETEGLKLSAPGPLRTFHDFRGFPDALYRISYPAVAEKEHVDRVARLLEAAGYDVEPDGERGLDHGAWVPLSLAYPDAAIPVVALSLPAGSTPASLHALGKILAPLKDQGVLIAGSGSTTHNLGELQPQGSAAPDWALRFDEWLETGLKSGSISYFDAVQHAPDFRRNHPTEEHLLPLFFAFGAGDAEVDLVHRSYEFGSLSMSYFEFAA